MKIINTMEVRRQNALDILRDIECAPGIANAEIAQARGVSVQTVSNIVNIMKNSGMVVTAGVGKSSGGRRPVQLSLNPAYQSYIGVSIAKHTVYLVLVDFAGTILDKRKFYRAFTDTEGYWSEIARLVGELREQAAGPCRIGIALPGFVDHETKMVLDADTLGVSDIPLGPLYTALGESVTVGDSCRLAALAQIFRRTEFKDFFFVLLSRRISGMLVLENEILPLERSSMDIGSMILDPSRQTALYGLPGSFLDLCSASRIIDTLRENSDGSMYEDFFAAIGSGDQEGTRMWNEYLRDLTLALHNIYSIFGVNIVLGGEMAKYIQPFAQTLDDNLSCLLPAGKQRAIDLCFSIYGEYDDAFGAALEARNSHISRSLPEILLNASASAEALA